MESKASRLGHIGKELTVLVLVKRRHIAGKVGLGNVEQSVAIEVRDSNAHAGL